MTHLSHVPNWKDRRSLLRFYANRHSYAEQVADADAFTFHECMRHEKPCSVWANRAAVLSTEDKLALADFVQGLECQGIQSNRQILRFMVNRGIQERSITGDEFLITYLAPIGALAERGSGFARIVMGEMPKTPPTVCQHWVHCSLFE